MKLCENCQHYGMSRTDGPMCTKNNKPTSPLAVKDCFEEAPGAGDAEVPSILASIPEAPAKRGGGRKKEHENYTDENGVLMKWCRCCKQYKPVTEFYKKTGPKDGYAYECKACRTKHQREKRAEVRIGRQKEFENYVDDVTGVTMKYCRTCKTYKPILAFYPKCDTADGFACECKECHNARSRGGRKPKRVQDPMPAELKEEKNVATIEALLYSISLDSERRTGELRFVCAGSEIQKAARIFSFGSDPVKLTLAVSAAGEDAE